MQQRAQRGLCFAPPQMPGAPQHRSPARGAPRRRYTAPELCEGPYAAGWNFLFQPLEHQLPQSFPHQLDFCKSGRPLARSARRRGAAGWAVTPTLAHAWSDQSHQPRAFFFQLKCSLKILCGTCYCEWGSFRLFLMLGDPEEFLRMDFYIVKLRNILYNVFSYFWQWCLHHGSKAFMMMSIKTAALTAVLYISIDIECWILPVLSNG